MSSRAIWKVLVIVPLLLGTVAQALCGLACSSDLCPGCASVVASCCESENELSSDKCCRKMAEASPECLVIADQALWVADLSGRFEWSPVRFIDPGQAIAFENDFWVVEGEDRPPPVRGPPVV